jgi:hypothetical protein
MSSTQQRSFQSSNYNQTQYKRKAPDSNVNIEYVPEENTSKSQFKGGEYVDYEEVK